MRRRDIVAMPQSTAWTRMAALLGAAILIIGSGLPVLAHGSGGISGGLASGLAHPILGLDHVAAMVAVGLWGALLGPPAIWVLPVVFPLVMTFGGVLGIAGVPIPRIEIGIAVSAVLLGVLVAGALRLPIWTASILVGGFAISHGYAHGAELPPGDDALAYSLGFVVATGLLHLAGIGLGAATRWPNGLIAVRTAGAGIAVAGLVFLRAAL